MNSKKKYKKPKIVSEEMYVETGPTGCTKKDCGSGPCGSGSSCTPNS